MFQLNPIGQILSDDTNTVIELKMEYRKALKNLDLFSHAHVFYTEQGKDRWRLQKKIIQIRKLDIKKGNIIICDHWKVSNQVFLFDIKPYFPSEDSLKEVLPTQASGNIGEVELTFSNGGFEVASIGLIRNVNGEIYVQLEEIEKIEYSYIKLFWWFHRFDSNRYRRITECTPPYENSPRSGVFSTRSPVRPNPIAMTIVKIIQVDYERKRIYLDGIESFDQTPCLGYSPYITTEDCRLSCIIPTWLRHWPEWRDESNDAQFIKVNLLEALLEEKGQENKQENKLEDKQENKQEKNQHQARVYAKDSVKANGIVVQGARENNLRGMDVMIPYGKITAVVGVSGSGKSSLVHDTIYTECRRRMEYLSSNRNLLQKPDVESMSGCIPAVIVGQESIRGNSLSTIGTYVNVYDYLRIIYANVAIRHCPNCGGEIIPMSREKIIKLVTELENCEILDLEKKKIKGTSVEDLIDKALSKGEGAFYVKLSDTKHVLLQTKQKCYRCNHLMFELTPQTFSYMNADCRCPNCNGTGHILEIDEQKIIEKPHLSLLDGASSFYGKLRTFQDKPNANWMKGQVFGLAEQMKVNLEQPWDELEDTFKDTLLHGSGDRVVTFRYQNSKNGRNGEITRPVEGILPIIARVNADHPDAKTLSRYMTQVTCKTCNGERLTGEGRTATINHVRYPQAAEMSFEQILQFSNDLYQHLSDIEILSVKNALESIQEIADIAKQLGIGYLCLNRNTNTLSGGERQRLKLLGAFINHMTGILYVFDEPSKGLHPKDYKKVVLMLQKLKNEGNTILMVEHNEDMIKIADHIIEIGPGAGKQGGLLVGEGNMKAMQDHIGTQISKYLNTDHIYEMPYRKKNLEHHCFQKMEGLHFQNLKNISLEYPQNAFTCICGVSGSGKSSLMKGEIFQRAIKEMHYSKVVMVDQLSIGKTSKSIIATYCGIMDRIRIEYASTIMAQQKSFDEKYFSFNGAGQCPTCSGDGKIKIKFMEDAYVKCSECDGKRYQKEIMEIRYHEKNIDDVLKMSVDEAILFWKDIDEIVAKLEAVQKTGLGYLLLGQSTASLSGGEAARMKLSKEMVTSQNSNVLYLLDEPTTGLHFSDIEHLLALITEIVKIGNTVITIEHNRYFLNNCDWLIELGPGAGDDGGQVVYQGKQKS